MNGEQIAKLILAGNDLGKARTILGELLKDGGDFSDRIAAILNKLKDCETELSNIQFGK